MPRYKNQVIISLQNPSKYESQTDDPKSFPRQGGTAYMLTKKAEQINLPTATLFLDRSPVKPKRTDFDNDESYNEGVTLYREAYEKFRKSSVYSQYVFFLRPKIQAETIIYFVGHGSSYGTSIAGADREGVDFEWPIEQLGDLIHEAAADALDTPYILPNGAEFKLTISLVACFSGVGLEKSCAANLNDYLWEKYKLKADIYGRVGPVSRYNGKALVKTVAGKHHEDESKILVIRDKNGSKTVLPFFYSIAPALRFITEITNSRPNDWHYRKKTGNLVSDLKADYDQLLVECTELEKKYSGINFEIVKSSSEDFFRIVSQANNVINYLKKDNLLSKFERRTVVEEMVESDNDFIAFMDQFTNPKNNFTLKLLARESQIVSDIYYSKKLLMPILNELNSKFPLLETAIVVTRNQTYKSYRLVINIINLRNVIENFKQEHLQKIETLLNQLNLNVTDSKWRADLRKYFSLPYKEMMNSDLIINCITTLVESIMNDRKSSNKCIHIFNAIIIFMSEFFPKLPSIDLIPFEEDTVVEGKRKSTEVALKQNLNVSKQLPVSFFPQPVKLAEKPVALINTKHIDNLVDDHENKKIQNSKYQLLGIADNFNANTVNRFLSIIHNKAQDNGFEGLRIFHCVDMLKNFCGSEKKYTSHEEFLKVIATLYEVIGDHYYLSQFKSEIGNFLTKNNYDVNHTHSFKNNNNHEF